MKHIPFILVLITALTSCAICKPPRNNREMEQRVRKHDRKPFIVQRWQKEQSDGYWVLTVVYSDKQMKSYLSPCKLSLHKDSIEKYLSR